MLALPIDPLLPDVVASLLRTPSLVIEAPPGAGKTTRVPRALLDHGFAERGEILVLEPRRIAARLAARRVADELGEQVGQRVGYRVRFEEETSRDTRITFVTEGILTRRLLSDPTLRGVSVVLLDELHERHLVGDIALAMLRDLQRKSRPELCLVAMSATLDAAPVAAFLGDAPVLRSEGRLFDVEVEHLPRRDERSLELQVTSAVRRLVDEGLDGDVLVFLPGAAEIRRAEGALASLASKASLLLLPLHGALPVAEQDRAVKKADRRKIILATNVAESSVTIDGVVAVIDSGLARLASYAPWSGLPLLRVAPIARARVKQRTGRAGRTRAGRCLRLFTAGDLAARPEHEQAEVQRVDLTETVLELVAHGFSAPEAFPWFEAPPEASLRSAAALLQRLGAIEGEAGHFKATDAGLRMLRFPVHPRQARIILEAEARGVGEDGCAVAALLAERDIVVDDGPRPHRVSHRSDLIEALEHLEEATSARFEPYRLRSMGLDPLRARTVDRARQQLLRLLKKGGQKPPKGPKEYEEALGKAVLSGFPDRVGGLRKPHNATGRAGIEVVFAAGGSALLHERSGVREADLVVALDAEQRSEGASNRVVVRLASAIEGDWLLDLFTDFVRDTTDLEWNAATERVEVVSRLAYETLVLEETRGKGGDPKAISALLAVSAGAAGGLRAFAKEDELDRLLARIAFVREVCPELNLPEVTGEGEARLLQDVCEGKCSFAELREAELSSLITASLPSGALRALNEAAPERVTLPGGRAVKINYEAQNKPWIESRLQDFFGLGVGPAIGKGRAPLVLHLLAPNYRAVQVTTDLAGFWAKHYPAIAKELRRKYPRHAWPDDPRSATPPPPPAKRR